MTSLTIGSRGSQLALWQANYVAARLQASGVSTHIEIIRTTGDHLQTASLAQAGGKGLFTKEIEDALLAGTIDLAVHSLKDLPTEMPPGLALAAIPERETPFDALCGSTLAALPQGARVGTSSGRRAAQLLILRPDLQIHPIRGNVDTRLRKLKSGEFEAIVLAAAGLRRLGLEHEIAELFAPQQMCPAPGQGALGIQTRTSGDAFEACAILNHVSTELAVLCERTLLAGLGGGCQLPVGAFASVLGEQLQAMAIVVAPDGSRFLRESDVAPIHHPVDLGHAADLGRHLSARLLERGAAGLLACAVTAEAT
jgi:hydroxymethylbilane synthase